MKDRVPFNIHSHEEKLHYLMSCFNHAKHLPRSKLPEMSHKPIFIIGMSRSGKTLLERILCEHPDIVGAGEGAEMRRAISTVVPASTNPKGIGATLQGMSETEKAESGRLFMELTTKQCPKAPYVILSCPFGYWYLGYYFEIFPEAKIIHCSRNPLDNCWNSFCKLYKSKNGYSYDFERLGYFYKSYQRIMNHWKTIYGDRIVNVQYEDLVPSLYKIYR